MPALLRYGRRPKISSMMLPNHASNTSTSSGVTGTRAGHSSMKRQSARASADGLSWG
jgi:hypothetical protein